MNSNTLLAWAARGGCEVNLYTQAHALGAFAVSAITYEDIVLAFEHHVKQSDAVATFKALCKEHIGTPCEVRAFRQEYMKVVRQVKEGNY